MWANVWDIYGFIPIVGRLYGFSPKWQPKLLSLPIFMAFMTAASKIRSQKAAQLLQFLPERDYISNYMYCGVFIPVSNGIKIRKID